MRLPGIRDFGAEVTELLENLWQATVTLKPNTLSGENSHPTVLGTKRGSMLGERAPPALPSPRMHRLISLAYTICL